MSISSVSSSTNTQLAALQQQATTNAVQPPAREAENDGDRDDGATAVKAPKPSVNLNGQITGTKISVSA